MQDLLTINIENNSELGPVVSSRTVAEELGRQHKHILEGIDEMIKKSTADISALLIPNQYRASNGKRNREYLLTKDGFTLYMFNIQGHNDFKIAYINKFNELYEDLTIDFDETPKEDYRDILPKLPVVGTFRNLVEKEMIVMRNVETNEVATFKSAREASRKTGICRKYLQEILGKNHLYKKKYLFTKETVCHRSRNTRNK